MKITKAIPCYTGGNIYVFTGSLDDGTYFIADDCCYDVRVLDIDPDTVEDEVWYEDFQKKHLVRDIPVEDAPKFFKDMLRWVIKNKPKGNYLEEDMVADLREVKTLKGDWR